MSARRRSTTEAGGTPWVVYGVVLVGIVVLVAVGMAGVLTMGAEGPGRSAPVPVASAVDPTVVPDTSWSPEPRHVFLADISTVDMRTGVASALPRSIRKILGARHFRVSPGGTEIAFDDATSVYVAKIDGSHRPAFHTRRGWRGVGAGVGRRTARRSCSARANSAFILDIDTGRITRLVSERRPVWYPNFSPDGRTILYTTVRHRMLILRTVPADGGRTRRRHPWSVRSAIRPTGRRSPTAGRRTTDPTRRR